MNLRQLLSSATEQLSPISDSARLDAEVLLAHCLQKNRTWLMTWPEKELSDTQLKQFQALLEQRIHGSPIAHITASREFWSLPLKVTPDTLIPRPETELMIEVILQQYPQTEGIQLADLGTGSGAIALALASEKPDWGIIATDRSPAALKIARENASQLQLNNIQFLEGSWFTPLADMHFDIIASNPPYIPEQDPHLEQGDVRFEPRSALASGSDGLDDIRLLCQQAQHYLHPNGLLIIEHGYDQKDDLYDIFMNSGYKNIQQHHDLAGQPRLTSGTKP